MKTVRNPLNSRFEVITWSYWPCDNLFIHVLLLHSGIILRKIWRVESMTAIVNKISLLIVGKVRLHVRKSRTYSVRD